MFFLGLSIHLLKRRIIQEYSQYEILFVAEECKGFSFFLNYTAFLISSYLSRYNFFEFTGEKLQNKF